MQQSVRNMCAKFKVDHLSHFRTGARQVRTIQNQIKTHFLIKSPSVNFFFEISFTSNKSFVEQKSKYLNSIRAFPFLNFIFLLI